MMAQAGGVIKAEDLGQFDLPKLARDVFEQGPAGAAGAAPTGGGIPNTPLTQAIFAATEKYEDATYRDKIRLSMLMGAMLEVGSLTGPWGVGKGAPGEESFGPYQINFAGIPEGGKRGGLTREDATDPEKAVDFMMNKHGQTYPWAVNQVPDELWETDPVAAATLAAFHAEMPAGYPVSDPTSATLDMALQAYSPERVQAAAEGLGGTTAAAAGGGPLGALAGGLPTEAPSLRELSNQEYIESAYLNRRYGMSVDEYKAAKIAVATGEASSIMEFWYRLNIADLMQQAEEANISWDDFAKGRDLLLSTAQIQNAKSLRYADQTGLSLEEYAYYLERGWSASDIETAVQLNYPLNEYFWAREQGVTDGDIREAKLRGTSLPEVVMEAKIDAQMAGARDEALGEFYKEWDQRMSGFAPKLRADAGFNQWLNQRMGEEQERWVESRERKARREAIESAQKSLEASIGPEAAQQTGANLKAGTVVSGGVPGEPPGAFAEVPIEEPEITLPTTEELIMEAAGSGLFPLKPRTYPTGDVRYRQQWGGMDVAGRARDITPGFRAWRERFPAVQLAAYPIRLRRAVEEKEAREAMTGQEQMEQLAEQYRRRHEEQEATGQEAILKAAGVEPLPEPPRRRIPIPQPEVPRRLAPRIKPRGKRRPIARI